MIRSLGLSLLNLVEREYLFTAESGESAEITKKERMTLCVPCGLSGKKVEKMRGEMKKMGLLESVKETLGFGPKLPKIEEVQKERMRLSMKEEQAIPELRRLKDKWKKLYEEGKDKDKYERRALLRQMNRIEGDIAKKDLELAKIDLGIRSVDKMDSILSKGKEIFKGEFWNKIEGTLTSEKLMDLMVEENFNEKRVLTKLGEIAKVTDKHVLDAIDQLPDEELDAVWGKEIETEELDEILDKKIEAQKKSLEIERF